MEFIPLRGSSGQSVLAGTELANRAMDKARAKLVPFILLMYILAFLDRANLGFAMKAFQGDTGISDAAFALGRAYFSSDMRCLKCRATSSCTTSGPRSGWRAS